MPTVHDDYKRVDGLRVTALAPCPVCGAITELWQYSESVTAPVSRVVMCSNGEPIGPRDGIVNDGCLLYMPPLDFYKPTAREAITFFNKFAAALVAQRAERIGT